MNHHQTLIAVASDCPVERALALTRRWTSEPWSDVAAWLRDEPELAGLGGVDRVLLLVATMHSGLRYTSRDARRVFVDEAREGELVVRAPEANPFTGEAEGLPEPWAEPVRFRATGVQGAAEAHAWLHDFARDTAHRCESAAEQLAFAGCVCAMLATELGPERTWRVYPHVEGAPLKTALCCGYDAVVVRGDGGAVLLATGMYCG